MHFNSERRGELERWSEDEGEQERMREERGRECERGGGGEREGVTWRRGISGKRETRWECSSPLPRSGTRTSHTCIRNHTSGACFHSRITISCLQYITIVHPRHNIRNAQLRDNAQLRNNAQLRDNAQLHDISWWPIVNNLATCWEMTSSETQNSARRNNLPLCFCKWNVGDEFQCLMVCSPSSLNGYTIVTRPSSLNGYTIVTRPEWLYHCNKAFQSEWLHHCNKAFQPEWLHHCNKAFQPEWLHHCNKAFQPEWLHHCNKAWMVIPL